MSCYTKRVIKAACIALNLVAYTLLLVMNYAANNSSGILFGNNSIGKMARKYRIEFNPAPWAFEIWKLVNAWTSIWIIYSLTHIFRTSVLDILTPLFFVWFILATLSNVAWTQFVSWEIIEPTTGFVFALLVFLYAALLCSYAGLQKQRYKIPQLDYWIIHLLVNNGVALYATWVTVAALRSLALNMTYFHDVRPELAVTIVLGVLTLITMIWFILENTLWREHLMYTLTIYPVLVWVLAASVIFNYNRVSRVNSAIMQVLLAMSSMFFLGKILSLLWRIVQVRDNRAKGNNPAPQNQKPEQKYTVQREIQNVGFEEESEQL